MNIELLLARDTAGALWLKSKDAGRAKRVYEVTEVCRLLRRSRRQVYRLLSDRSLQEAGRFLGSILVDARSLERLRSSPPSRQPLPADLQALFPDYDIKALNVGRDRSVILGRILEEGGPAELSWMSRRYRRREIRRFLETDGHRHLSARSRGLWELVFATSLRKTREASSPWESR